VAYDVADSRSRCYTVRLLHKRVVIFSLHTVLGGRLSGISDEIYMEVRRHLGALGLRLGRLVILGRRAGSISFRGYAADVMGARLDAGYGQLIRWSWNFQSSKFSLLLFLFSPGALDKHVTQSAEYEWHGAAGCRHVLCRVRVYLVE
jgi:hypothetical protein